MKSVFLPDSSPLITLRLVFHAGAALDPPGKPGVAWMTAMMHSSAGTRTRTYKQILDELFPMAGDISCQADKEMTVFAGETHRDNLDAFADIFRECLLDPGWNEEDFARLKDETINFLAVNLRGQNDEELGKEVLYQQLYPRHPYAWHNAGTVASLEAMTLDDLRAFRAAHYTQANLTVGVAGDYRPDFSALPAGTPSVVAIPRPPEVERTGVLIVEKPARSVAISLGFPIEVTRSHRDYRALEIAASCLGQHRMSSGRLFTRMRQLRGLNYGDYAYIEYFPGGMYTLEPPVNMARSEQIFQLWIRPVERAQALFALRLALYELDRFVREGITSEEFQRTRSFLSKYQRLLVKTKAAELGYAIDRLFYGDVEADPSHEEVNAAIRRHLRADRLKIVMVAEDAAGLRDDLLRGDPSPMTYNSPKPDELLAEDKIVERLPLGIADVQIVDVASTFA